MQSDGRILFNLIGDEAFDRQKKRKFSIHKRGGPRPCWWGIWESLRRGWGATCVCMYNTVKWTVHICWVTNEWTFDFVRDVSHEKSSRTMWGISAVDTISHWQENWSDSISEKKPELLDWKENGPCSRKKCCATYIAAKVAKYLWLQDDYAADQWMKICLRARCTTTRDKKGKKGSKGNKTSHSSEWIPHAIRWEVISALIEMKTLIDQEQGNSRFVKGVPCACQGWVPV